MSATSLRTQTLIAAAAVLAGAAAGVLVQAAIEIGRSRRGDRSALVAAADQLDHLDTANIELQRELHTAWAAIRQQTQRAEAAERKTQTMDVERQVTTDALVARDAAAARLHAIARAVDVTRPESPDVVLGYVRRELRDRSELRAPVINAAEMPAPVELQRWEPNTLAPCLCGAGGPDGDGGLHEPNCPCWEPAG